VFVLARCAGSGQNASLGKNLLLSTVIYLYKEFVYVFGSEPKLERVILFEKLRFYIILKLMFIKILIS